MMWISILHNEAEGVGVFVESQEAANGTEELNRSVGEIETMVKDTHL